jgi:serine/threonine protein kinase
MDFAEAKVFVDSLLKLRVVGGWELQDYVSHGKSAVVLRASREETEAVIKIFHPGLIENYGRSAQIIRISRERELVGKYHPNMVRILDAGECEVTHHLYVAMENAGGQPLSKVCGKVPKEKIGRLIEQLANAAMQLENWGLIHRDIKPDNIHIRDDFESLVLLDFGVIKPFGDDSATRLQVSKAFIGTHQYSPPEMIHGRELNTLDGWRAITFYQIGAVLHDLITGQPIFHDATGRHADLVSAIDNKIIFVENIEGVDSGLCNLATRCLLKSPSDRLRLVTWEDFLLTKSADEQSSLSFRREALKRRVRLGFCLKSTDAIHDNEQRRIETLKLQRIIDFARRQFDQALAELGNIMPARSTEINGGMHPNSAITHTFVAAPDLGIHIPFRVQTTIAVHPEGSIIDVYVRASKGLDNTEVGWTHLGAALENLDGFSNVFQNWMLQIIEEMIGI